MSDQLREVLKHRYIYVPRGKTDDTTGPGKRLGLAVAHALGAPLTVLAPQKGSATHHPELAKLEIVTERSGYPQDGGVVLAWCPTYKVMEKAQRLETSMVVLVEWIPGEFDSWAKVHRAYNVVIGEVMDAGLSPEAANALEGIVDEGYKGWHDDIAERMTRSYLADLDRVGAYDRELVLAYARRTKSEESIRRLKRILDKLGASRASVPTTSTSLFRTSRDW